MDNVQKFSYGKMQATALVLSIAFAAIMTYAAVRAAQQYRPGDWIYFLVPFPFSIVASVSAILTYRDVVISSVGIGRSFYGRGGRLIPWEKIVGVTCGQLSKDGKAVDSYYLRTRPGPFSGVIVLPTLNDVDRLTAAINAEVVRRAIPISARPRLPRTAPITLDHLPVLRERYNASR